MLCTGRFVLFRPDRWRPPHFSKVVYLDGVYNWDSTTLFHAPQILDFKKKYFVNDRLCCVPIPSLDCFIYLKVFYCPYWLHSNPIHPCRAAEHPPT